MTAPRPPRPSHPVADLARRQLGLLSRAQAASLGLNATAVRRRLDGGHWQAVLPDVFVVNGAPLTWRTRALAACLATGGVVSHRSAAALLGVDGFRQDRIEITVARNGPRSRARLADVTLHHSTDLHLAGVVVVDAVPVTDASRLVVDLGSVVSADRYREAVEDLVGRRMLDWDRALDVLVTHARRGRNGVGALRALLDDRFGADIPESALKRVYLRLAATRGLPEPVLQYEVADEDGFVARVDVAYPEHRLLIELDSLRWHGPARFFESDRIKRTRLTAAGWRVLALTWHMMLNDPDAVARSVRAVIRAPAAGTGLARPA